MKPVPGSETGYYEFRSSLKHISMQDFFHDIRYILIFYVIGDILTTVFALETGIGYEANFIIAGLLESQGYYSIVLLKLVFLSFCFADYLYLKSRGYCSMWNLTRHMITLLGILAVVNNLLVISGVWSPLYTLMYGI